MRTAPPPHYETPSLQEEEIFTEIGFATSQVMVSTPVIDDVQETDYDEF